MMGQQRKEAGRVLVLVILYVSSFADTSLAQKNKPFAPPQAVSSLRLADFVERFSLWFTKSLDVSPDGKVAAVLHVGDTDRVTGVWLTLWDVKTGQLSKAKQLETWMENQYNYHYRQALRFAPDGETLFVLTGPRLVALEFPSLKARYAIEAPVPPDRAGKDAYISEFAFAREVDRIGLVILVTADRARSKGFEFRLLNSITGEPLHTWKGRGVADSVALSADGSLTAVSINPIWRGARVPANQKSVFVCETATGNVVQSFNTDYTAGDAVFVNGARLLLTIAEDQAEYKHFPSHTLKLWDVASGRLLREFSYGKVGLRGSFRVSADEKRLAVMTHWARPFDVRWHRYPIRGYARWLLWNFDGELLHVSKDIPGSGRWGDLKGDFLIVLSGDGNTIVVGREQIMVYSSASSAAKKPSPQ